MTDPQNRPASPPGLMTRLMDFAPSSVDREARTAEIIWSVGADVTRRDYTGPWVERLSMDPEHVDLSRLNRSASLLNSHNAYDLSAVLGVVVEGTARTDGKRGTATVKFSSRPDVAGFFDDVAAGIIRNVSVGYTVQAWKDEEDPKTKVRVRTAIRWTPLEISLVAMPADAGARVRSGEVNVMPPEEQQSQQSRAEPGADTQTQPVQARAAANAEIRSIAGLSGLDQRWIDAQIDAGATPEQARAAAFDEMRARSATVLRTEGHSVQYLGSQDDPALRCRQMGEALYARVNPSHQVSEPARRYANFTLVDAAREILRLRGVAATGLTPAGIVTRALHTTSDFPIILGDTVGRTLRQSYEAAPNNLRLLGRRTSAVDFRAKTSVQLSEAPRLERLGESGEIRSGSFAEAKESYKLETFARKLGISRQMIVNDDLGAFSDLARKFGQAAAETEAGVMVELLVSNAGAGPLMNDGENLFDTAHGNLAASGAAISDASLGSGRLAMRTQTGITGELIAVSAKYLLVPPGLETVAEKWSATIAPATADAVNPFAGKITPVVEARLQKVSAVRWYLVADPNTFDGLEYAYLGGNEGPMVNSFQSVDVDGVSISVVHDFGAGWVDHRGWFQNPGA